MAYNNQAKIIETGTFSGGGNEHVRKPLHPMFTLKGRATEPPKNENPQVHLLGTFNIRSTNIGSSDCLIPSYPSPGEVRRMFGIDAINAEPEYVYHRDPAPWAPTQNLFRPQAIAEQNTSSNVLTQNASCGTDTTVLFQTNNFQANQSCGENFALKEDMAASDLLISSTEIERLKKEVLVFALFLASKMNRAHWNQLSTVYESAQSNEIISITNVENKVKRLAEMVIGKKAVEEKLLSYNLDEFDNWLQMAKVLLNLYSKGINSTTKLNEKTYKGRGKSGTQLVPKTKVKFIPKQVVAAPVKLKSIIKTPARKTSSLTEPFRKVMNVMQDKKDYMFSTKLPVVKSKASTTIHIDKELDKTKGLLDVITRVESILEEIRASPAKKFTGQSKTVQVNEQHNISSCDSTVELPSCSPSGTWDSSIKASKPGGLNFFRAISFGPSKTYLKKFTRSLSGNYVFTEPLSRILCRGSNDYEGHSTCSPFTSTPTESLIQPISDPFMDEEGDTFVDPPFDNLILMKEYKTEIKLSTFCGQTDENISEAASVLGVTKSLYKMSKDVLVRTTKLSVVFVIFYWLFFILNSRFRNTQSSERNELTLTTLVKQVSEWIDEFYDGAIHLGGGS